MIFFRKTFKGGTHPPQHKRTRDEKIVDLPVSDVLYVPLSQHIGAPCNPLVKKGDTVLKGQKIGEATGLVSVPVHSPVSGTVKDITDYPHILGSNVSTVVIENDHSEQWAEGLNMERKFDSLSSDELREIIQENGIAGMGGATFPTHVKLAPPKDNTIDTVIINGVECEPYLTADHRLMLEDADSIVEGLKLILKITGAPAGIIAIENNKPDAIEMMREKVSDCENIAVIGLPVKYPQGAEKQLIKALLHREVPSGGLPLNVGVVVQNVATASSIYYAVKFNRPLIERVVTVTGESVQKAGNYRIKIGTRMSEILEYAGLSDECKKVIAGGPMMGIAQGNLDAPVVKGTSGILAVHHVLSGEFDPCIRCGRCVEGCPVYLTPSLLSTLIEADNITDANEANLFDCIECGVCTYVCPAKRPIVHQIKYAKSEINKKKKAKVGKEA